MTEAVTTIQKTENTFVLKTLDLITLAITSIIFTLGIFEHWFFSLFFLSLPLILIAIININNLVFITKKAFRRNYWLIINNILRKTYILIALSSLLVLGFAVLFDERKITFLFESWTYNFQNLCSLIINTSIFLSTIGIQLVTLIISLKIINPVEDTTKMKTSMQYLVLIYYSILFIFIIFFLIKKIFKKGV